MLRLDADSGTKSTVAMGLPAVVCFRPRRPRGASITPPTKMAEMIPSAPGGGQMFHRRACDSAGGTCRTRSPMVMLLYFTRTETTSPQEGSHEASAGSLLFPHR